MACPFVCAESPPVVAKNNDSTGTPAFACGTSCPVEQPGMCPGTISSECTDQCVVIACSDPSHEAEAPCFQDGRCDFVCDDDFHCPDCQGFEDFLCCDEFHSGDALVPEWDPIFNDLFCTSCAPNTQPYQYQNPLQLFSDVTDGLIDERTPCTSSEASPSFHSTVHAGADDHDAFFSGSSTLSPSLPPPSPATTTATTASSPPANSISTANNAMIPCMWGDCNLSFSSLAELVGHVNLQHLNPSTHTRPEACGWKDCTQYSTPSLIPGPSSLSSSVTDSILSSHLLHDHLGLSSPPPLARTPHIEESSTAPTAPTSEEIPTPASPVHLDHACKWQDCHQSFSNCNDLTNHLAAEHVGAGKGRYECFWDGCNRRGELGFATRQKICRHLQSHTGHKPFQCAICKQSFSESATLQQHLRRHTQEKPCACDFPGCGKAFATTGALTIHKRTHNGYKPFKCPYCERTFSESSNFSKHMRTHTGIRPYVCDVGWCGKAFARPDQLNRHMLVHTKEKKVKE